MMNQEIIFEEKQYLGRNKYWLNLRLLLALFCFIVYFRGDTSQESGLLLITGIGILLISILLLFIVHFQTTLYPDSLVLDGIWTTRKVKINLNSIISAKKSRYSKFFINNPVYNLHKKGTIRFYTLGKDAVRLTDKDGLIYMIGSQHAEKLALLIRRQLKEKVEA